MSTERTYRHTQTAPLCLILYGVAIQMFVMSWVLQQEPVVRWLFPALGAGVLLLAASFHHLTVEDEGDRLSLAFGPVQLFQRRIPYSSIVHVESGRTSLLDGWGIHRSLRGGWVWNIWGRDCVVLRLQHGVLRIGTDDREQLLAFLQTRHSQSPHAPSQHYHAAE